MKIHQRTNGYHSVEDKNQNDLNLVNFSDGGVSSWSKKNNDSENFSSQTFGVGGGMLEVIISNVEKLRKNVEKLRKDVEKLRKNVEKLRKNDRKNKSKKFIMIKQIKFGSTLHDASNLELERATAELKLYESSPSPS